MYDRVICRLPAQPDVLFSDANIINELNSACQSAAETKPSGNGLIDKPYELDGGVPTWLYTSRHFVSGATVQGVEIFYAIAARRIKKVADNMYMADAGPLGNKGDVQGAFGGGEALAYRVMAKNFRDAWIKTKNEKTPEIEKIAKTKKGVKKEIAMEAAAIDMQVQWNKDKAETFRAVLKGALKLGNAAVGSIEQLMPSLAAALYLAEPARNATAFPVNLMALDLLQSGRPYGQAGTKHYTWDKLLWHPEAIDQPDDPLAVPAWAAQPVAKPQLVGGGTALPGATGPAANIGDLHKSGGKIPATMTGSALGLGHTFVSMRTVSVVARWLCAMPNTPFTPLRPADPLPPAAVVYNAGMHAAHLARLRPAIRGRLTTFDYQL